MRYNKQTILHDPEHGQYGDCLRTALSCLLNMDQEEVPHFCATNPTSEDLWPAINAWLAETCHLVVYSVAYDCSLEQILTMQQIMNPGLYYLLAGKSPRGCTHQVVACGDQIIHDPAPEGGGLIGPCVEDGFYWVSVLVSACHLSRKDSQLG